MTVEPSLDLAIENFRRRLDENDWSGQSAARRHILEVFLRLALEQGFSSVSMRKIAQVVGIKAPSLYAHFPEGRDEIVAQSMRWHFHKFGSDLLAEIASCTTADEVWTAMVRVHVTRQLELPEDNLWDLIIATDRMVGNLPPEVSAEAHELVSLYEQLYRSAAAEMGVDETAGPVTVVMTLLEGARRWCMDGTESVTSAADRADHLTRALLRMNETASSQA